MSGFPDMTARDAEILRLTAEGRARPEIMAALGVSRDVVDNVRSGKNRLARALVSAGLTPGVVTYEAACLAIAAAKSVDEAKGIADKAEAMRVYARQAKNRSLEVDAAEIRIRAERRLGELIVAQKETVGLNEGGRPPKLSAEPPHPSAPQPPSPAGGEGKEKTRAAGEQVSKPTLAEAGIDRKLSSRAQRLAALPAQSFEAQIVSWRDKAELDGERVSVRLIRGEAGLGKAAVRATREAELGARIVALDDAAGGQKFGVIYADPEWRFEPYSRESGMDRAPDNHYPTSATAAIAARPVADIAAPDCVLFLWATAPMLPDALQVMAAWGFAYRSHFVWHKDRVGTGYWNRSEHELLLLGVRGHVPAPAPGTQWPSVIEAPSGRHSQKPNKFAELIEAYFPTLPTIELNARRARPGWAAWGNEAPDPNEVVLSKPESSGKSENLVRDVALGGDRPGFAVELDALIRRHRDDPSRPPAAAPQDEGAA